MLSKTAREKFLGFEARNTGIADQNGQDYVNTEDLELLGKLGFDFSVGEYLGLEKTSEVLDVYSYIEKIAGVPKEVAKLIDSGKAFSGEYLKDMGYKLPKGYEVKGDLCCPVEKKAAVPTQQYEGESVRPFGGVAGGMGGGVGLQSQSNPGSNQPALRPTPPQLRPMPTQKAPRPVNPAPGNPAGVTNTSPTMSPGTGNIISTHAPLNVNNISMGGQVTPPSFGEVYGKMKTRPIDFVVGAADIGANLVSPGGSKVLRTLDNIRQGVEASRMLTQNKPNTITEPNALDAIEHIGGYVAGMPDWRAKVIGTGMQLGVKGGRLVKDYDQARAQLPDILTKQPVMPPSNYPATNFSIRPEQQAQPNVNIDSQIMAKNSEFTRFVEYFNKTAGDKPGLWANVHAKKARGEKAAKPGDADYPDKKQWKKLTKAASSLSALKKLIRQLRSSGVTVTKDPKEYAKIVASRLKKETPGVGPTLKKLTSQVKENIPPSYNAADRVMYIPRKPPESITGQSRAGKLLAKKYRMSDAIMHEGGHALHHIDDPGLPFRKLTEHPFSFPSESLALERIANNNAINFMRDSNVPGNMIENYKQNFAKPGYGSYRKYMSWDRASLGSPAYSVENPAINNAGQLDKLYKPYADIMDEAMKRFNMPKQAEYKWHKSKDLHRDVTNGRHYPFSFLTGEAKELVDAIKNRDMANFKEEVGDTTYAAQMLAAQATGLNHPVYADLGKFHKRESVWKDIFKEKGSTYHPKHMEGGSNFAKASKIIKAFASAGIKINQREAERLANKYTGGKMEKESAYRLPRKKISVNNQELLPGMSEQLSKQPFNHAENAFTQGRISKSLRDSIVSGRRAEELRPSFEKLKDFIKNL